MKAAVYYENGGPEVVRYEEVPDVVCRPDEILIRVEAISVEAGDLLHRQSFPHTSLPHIVGYSTAGEIIELGSEVERFRLGQRYDFVSAAGTAGWPGLGRRHGGLVTVASVTGRIPLAQDLSSCLEPRVARAPAAFAGDAADHATQN